MQNTLSSPTFPTPWCSPGHTTGHSVHRLSPVHKEVCFPLVVVLTCMLASLVLFSKASYDCVAHSPGSPQWSCKWFPEVVIPSSCHPDIHKSLYLQCSMESQPTPFWWGGHSTWPYAKGPHLVLLQTLFVVFIHTSLWYNQKCAVPRITGSSYWAQTAELQAQAQCKWDTGDLHVTTGCNADTLKPLCSRPETLTASHCSLSVRLPQNSFRGAKEMTLRAEAHVL